MSEHLVYALWGLGEVADLLDRVEAEWVQLNIDDAHVADAQLRLSTFDEPVQAFLTLPADARAELDGVAKRYAGWRVQTEVPIKPQQSGHGERVDALANVALLRRPAELPYDEWLHIWKHDHTPIGIADQGSFGYVQHRVLERLTADSPDVAAIVEELFPMAAKTDLHSFYGTSGDEDLLRERMTRMLASVARFGADRDVDVVPTSRYLWQL